MSRSFCFRREYLIPIAFRFAIERSLFLFLFLDQIARCAGDLVQKWKTPADYQRRWDIPGIKKFMIIFGLLSTVLDVLCFLVLWFVFGFKDMEHAGFFQCGWFMFGVISQTMVIHTIRTPKVPFIQDRASKELVFSTLTVCMITLLIGFTGIAALFSLPVMPISFLAWMAGLMVVYTVLAQAMKTVYIRLNKEWV